MTEKNNIYLPIWIKLLSGLTQGIECRKLHLYADVTTSHASRTMRDLELYGIIKSEKDGRFKKISLTVCGDELAKKCFIIESIMSMMIGNVKNKKGKFEEIWVK